mgnify:CR=1 FL=1
MQIDDLTAGVSISFIIHLNNEELQFESRILEVYSRRHTLLAEGVFTDDKIISFRGKGCSSICWSLSQTINLSCSKTSPPT